MSKLSKDIDNKNLFEMLTKAIEDDKMYWIQNDAKIKASSTSKTYDEFRETVAAAHLTSLQRSDKNKKIFKWNSICQHHNNDE